MRGCLTVLVLGALVLGAGVWFGGPPVAGAVIETGLTSSGLRAAEMDVTVETDPRWELAGGRADRVRVTATDATFQDLAIERLDIDLRDVALIDRQASEIDGRLEGVVVDDGPAAGLRIPIIRLSGGDPIVATTEIATDDAAALVSRAVTERTGQEPTEVTLSAPNRMTIVLGSATIDGQLEIASGGALVLRSDGPAADLIGEIVLMPAAALPIELQDVQVRGRRLVLEGHLSAGLLG
jgi:hypothetical protein